MRTEKKKERERERERTKLFLLSYGELPFELVESGQSAPQDPHEEVLKVGEEAVARGGEELDGERLLCGGNDGWVCGGRRRSRSSGSSARSRSELRSGNSLILLRVVVVFLGFSAGRHCWAV